VAAGVEPPRELLVYEWIEHLVYALADQVMFTNENQRDYMLGYCQDRGLADAARAKSVVSTHPVPPADFYHRTQSRYQLDPTVTNIGYFGTFYSSRGLEDVTEALRRLRPQTRSRLQFHVFTSKPEAVHEEVAALGLADVIRVNSFVPFFEMLNLCTRLDVLMVNDARTRGAHALNPYLPSKWSDYLGSGTPVWVIYEDGSVLSRMEAAYRSALEDVDDAIRVLEAVVSDRPIEAVSGGI
jgi:glycosyltransferase involved in cell wall biosynthesis